LHLLEIALGCGAISFVEFSRPPRSFKVRLKPVIADVPVRLIPVLGFAPGFHPLFYPEPSLGHNGIEFVARAHRLSSLVMVGKVHGMTFGDSHAANVKIFEELDEALGVLIQMEDRWRASME